MPRAVLINVQECPNTKAMKQYGRKSFLDVKLMSTAFTSWMLPNFFPSFFSGWGRTVSMLPRLALNFWAQVTHWSQFPRVAGVQACVNVPDTQILKLAFGNRAASKQGFTFIDLCSSMCFREKAAACIYRDV